MEEKERRQDCTKDTLAFAIVSTKASTDPKGSSETGMSFRVVSTWGKAARLLCSRVSEYGSPWEGSMTLGEMGLFSRDIHQRDS